MPYTYSVALKLVSDRHGNPADGGSCEFETSNHDNILEIIERAEQNSILPEEDVAAFCLGLKLVTEVVMKHRGEPPFSELWPHLGSFIRSIKAPTKSERVSK
jgi:hypothetical protein